MAKKSLSKVTMQLALEARAKQSDRVYPTEPHELNSQRQRLKKAATAGAEALKSSAPAVTTDPYPAPAAVPPPPLTPLAALWPIPAPSPVAEAPMPPASPKMKVTFILPKADAKRVSLSGDFNFSRSAASFSISAASGS